MTSDSASEPFEDHHVFGDRAASGSLSILIISCSLDPQSKSRQLAVEGARRAADRDAVVELIDLRQVQLPAFDNAQAHDHASVTVLKQAILRADAVIIASPVYNWSLGSATKNMVEATGATGDDGRQAAWFDKFVTFFCAGGLPHSYTAYTELASSMTLDFKCILNPYMVYGTDRDMVEGSLSESLDRRMDKTLDVAFELALRLKNRTYSSYWEI